jgi:tRNA N6-adenosine threonylcarbamoyltransferase
MPILGIESSCDDLSMALVEKGSLLANVTASQTLDHAPYGGVVPEIASRRHLETLEATLDLLLQKAKMPIQEISGIAATYAPGLVGSLLVGLNFAKALAFGLNRPFRGVHHIEGHLWSAFLENEPQLPFLGLVVSGGHSHLYWVQDFGNYALQGQTVDDAAGEAFDKVAKLLGLPYPGGPAVDKLSERGDPKAFEFALPRVKGHPLHTSFSGMKTAALEYIEQRKPDGFSEYEKADFAASFQAAVVLALQTMVERGLEKVHAKQLVVVGGVACNRALRLALQESASKYSIPLVMPTPKFCTDNGAMIAYTGEKYLAQGKASPLSLNALARAPLGIHKA